jgi:hypothetical protein
MRLGHASTEPKGRQGRRRNVPIGHLPNLQVKGATAALLAFVISATFVVIGFLSATHGQAFNWDSASVAATALATASLATYTAGLATSTAEDVKATRSLAKLAKKDQQQRDRATLIVTGVAYVDASPGLRVAGVTLVNIGLAPAAFITLEIEGLSDSEQRIFHGESDNGNFLHAGGECRVDIPLTPEPVTREPDPPTVAKTKVSGVYLQRNHLQRSRTHADQNAGHFEWRLDELTRQTFIK